MKRLSARGALGRAAVVAAAVGALVGAPAAVASAAAPPAALGVDRAQYSFGQVSVGVSPERTFTVTNTGGRASRALTASLSGASSFTVTADSCTGRTLGPRKTCTVTVRFAPRAVGAVSATLSVTGKGGSTGTSVTLHGAGRGFGDGGDSIYWAVADGTISTGTLGGQGATILVSPRTYPDQDDPNQLVVVDDVIYWADTRQGTINSVPISGGDDNITTLYSGQSQPTGVAVSGRNIYWTNTGDGTINTGPLYGGTQRTLLSGQQQPKGLTTNGTELYWANSGDGTINVAPLSGGRSSVLVSGQPQAYGVAVEGNDIYWTTWNDVQGGPANQGGVFQAPLSGAYVTQLVAGESFPSGVAVDSTTVYWASRGENAIKQVTLSGEPPRVLFDLSGRPAPPNGVALPYP